MCWFHSFTLSVLAPGQPPNNSSAGLRSNLFDTKSIISHKKQAEFIGFKSRRQYNLFLENYPACNGLRIQWFALYCFQPVNFYLIFNDIHLWAVIFSVIVINYIFQDGKSDYFQGNNIEMIFLHERYYCSPRCLMYVQSN